jgi:DNA-binding MarR family transcriptional regulator
MSKLTKPTRTAKPPEPASPFSVAEANDSSGFLLWQVTALWQRRIAQALRPHQLTQVQYALLASLLWLSSQGEEVTQARLAAHAKLDVMMTSQVLRALEERSLLERRPHPTDTRAKALRLTAAGRALTTRAVPAVESADAAFFSALGTARAGLNRNLLALISAQQ